MKQMLCLYEQTLAEMGVSNNSNSSGNKIKNKYLVMSEIKEQSNEGGSMISREDTLWLHNILAFYNMADS